MTWTELTKTEPRLAALLKQAKAIKSDDDPHFCANDVWYGEYGLKGQLVQLVGWTAQINNPQLRSMQAYDLAYKKIYDVLPPCRDCYCMR